MMNDVKQRLMRALGRYERSVIAFSGGVDSSVLARAYFELWGDATLLVTAVSPLLPESERVMAAEIAGFIGATHVWQSSDDLADREFVANDARRCYYCKRRRFGELTRWAAGNGYKMVLEGSNIDDYKDYRPGMEAVAEFATVASPFIKAGLDKAAIRALAREWNLAVWDKPSAACLASRLEYGLPITAERLRQVELGEELLRRFVPRGQVRLRHHGMLARIEVDEALLPVLTAPAARLEIERALRELGFVYVTLDMAGYRMGSHNAALPRDAGSAPEI